MYTAFGLQKKTRVLFEPVLHTKTLNVWLCLPIFVVYGRKAVQRATRKTVSMIFSFLLK